MSLNNSLDLNTLRLFVAVVQAGSFSKAHEQIGTPIPTLSRRIADLEQQLGVQLFDRGRFGVKPTVLGQKLYEQVKLPMDSLLQVKHGLDSEQELQGKLRLSMVVGIEPLWALIADFQRQYPSVTVHCQATDRTVDLMEDGIDVAFRFRSLQTDNVIAFPMLSSRGVLIATPNFVEQYGTPDSIDTLVNYPVIGWGRVGEPVLTVNFKEKPISLPLKFSSNDNSALLYMVLKGQAICYMSEYNAKPLIARGDVVEILPDCPMQSVPLYAVYLSHRHQSAVIKAFLKFIKERYY